MPGELAWYASIVNFYKLIAASFVEFFRKQQIRRERDKEDAKTLNDTYNTGDAGSRYTIKDRIRRRRTNE